MLIALTARREGLDAPLDPSFGRAMGFVYFDPDTGATTWVANTQNRQAAQGAGIQAAEAVARAGATHLVTGNCGPKAFRALAAAGVQVFTGASGTVREAVEAFQAGRLEAASGPNVEGHWQ